MSLCVRIYEVIRVIGGQVFVTPLGEATVDFPAIGDDYRPGVIRFLITARRDLLAQAFTGTKKRSRVFL